MKALSQPSFVPNKRKYLFCGDEEGMERLSPVIQRVQKENHSYQLLLVDEKEGKDISHWLQNQNMGSYLYIAVEWNKLKHLKKVAEDQGFSVDEAQCIGHGARFIQVFCYKCHLKTVVSGESIKQVIDCPHCHLTLSVSDHYSPLHDSYLGYPATIEKGSGHA
ncbi:dimethylamine monooxygenase subunit DmmA family protein [Rossellomorea aquimaris]|uniref:dimethylamine monooxygenase subunit DmmA family protein n=1 Tax=Rossellomorea aquimaris TaxID=189382 RepID=UPI001CFE6CC6|nr:dimethylamine monooxygenase subunit DmmA family protein [Rossellomorea aquimaris]